MVRGMEREAQAKTVQSAKTAQKQAAFKALTTGEPTPEIMSREGNVIDLERSAEMAFNSLKMRLLR